MLSTLCVCGNSLHFEKGCTNTQCRHYYLRSVPKDVINASQDIKVERLTSGTLTCRGCYGPRIASDISCPNEICVYHVVPCIECGVGKYRNEWCNNPTCKAAKFAINPAKYLEDKVTASTSPTKEFFTNADPDHPRNGFVRVGNGSKFYLYNPSRTKGVRLIDLIMPIAEIARYNFHLPVHYSVAEHCIYASRFCSNPLYALLHDLAETIIGDLPAPVKAMCPDYKRVELRVEKWVFEVFGLKCDVPADMKYVDKRLLNTEQMHFGRSADLIEKFPPYGDLRIGCWKPTYAVLKYYERLQELTNGRYQLESILEMPDQPDEYFEPPTGNG
jgi:uncharacterized protein